jgi:hypothetical protein
MDLMEGCYIPPPLKKSHREIYNSGVIQKRLHAHRDSVLLIQNLHWMLQIRQVGIEG